MRDCPWTRRPCCSSKSTAIRVQVEEDAEKVGIPLPADGGHECRVAQDAAERDKVWEARRAALSALSRVKPTTVLEDATVPRSKIPAMIRSIEEIARDSI